MLFTNASESHKKDTKFPIGLGAVNSHINELPKMTPPRSNKSYKPLYFERSDGDQKNYFFSDQDVTCQAAIASPMPIDNHIEGMVRHRVLFAFQAGDSAAALFFISPSGCPDRRHLELNSSPASNRILDSNKFVKGPGAPTGVITTLCISTPVVLQLGILGSVRDVRNYCDGDGILNPKIRDSSMHQRMGPDQTFALGRKWQDGKTMTVVSFSKFPDNISRFADGSNRPGLSSKEAIQYDPTVPKPKIRFATGEYLVSVECSYPQTPSLMPSAVLKLQHHELIKSEKTAVQALSFLCNTGKILAGGWGSLKYFGRESMISLMLLGPILSSTVLQIGLRAVLERINATDGSVCHEENNGEYVATQTAWKGRSGSEPEYDYKMVRLLLLYWGL